MSKHSDTPTIESGGKGTIIQSDSQSADPRQHLINLELADKKRRYPNVPGAYLVRPKFTVKDANSLTKAVIRCLELHGCHANRIQSQGQYNARSDQWQHSHTKRGTADISAIIGGRAVSIEIKWGRDRLSTDQKTYAEGVEAAGGVYLVVRTYEGFWTWFEGFAPDLVDKKRRELL